MQQKLYLEEIQAMKDLRRNDRSRQTSEYKKIDQCLSLLDKKIHNDRLTSTLAAGICNRNYGNYFFLSLSKSGFQFKISECDILAATINEQD